MMVFAKKENMGSDTSCPTSGYMSGGEGIRAGDLIESNDCPESCDDGNFNTADSYDFGTHKDVSIRNVNLQLYPLKRMLFALVLILIGIIALQMARMFGMLLLLILMKRN